MSNLTTGTAGFETGRAAELAGGGGLAALLLALALALGYGLGAATGPATTAPGDNPGHDASAPASPEIEDWHGNVRRSGR